MAISLIHDKISKVVYFWKQKKTLPWSAKSGKFGKVAATDETLGIEEESHRANKAMLRTDEEEAKCFNHISPGFWTWAPVRELGQFIALCREVINQAVAPRTGTQ